LFSVKSFLVIIVIIKRFILFMLFVIMLNWNNYPTISEITGNEVLLESPGKKEVVQTTESLQEDEYLVLQNFDLMPYKFGEDKYKPAEFMKNGPELKIKIADKPARYHIEKELKRFRFNRPKRGYKWTNPKNKTSVFTPLSSIIDGAKIFSYSIRGEINDIKVGGHDRTAWLKVPSRTKENHKVIYNSLPDNSGKNWHGFKPFCDCGERFYYGHTSTKYTNPEIYICPHIIAGYHKTMGIFHEINGNKHVPALFPGPKEKTLKYDTNLAKTFVKDPYKRRLKKGEREVLLSAYQGLEKNCFSFNLPQKWEQKVF